MVVKELLRRENNNNLPGGHDEDDDAIYYRGLLYEQTQGAGEHGSYYMYTAMMDLVVDVLRSA